MDIYESVKQWNESYAKNVMPCIKEGDYDLAYIYFSNSVTAMGLKGGKLSSEIHSGMSYHLAAQNLLQSLEKGDKNSIDRARIDFEAYLAQTNLPNSIT